MVTIYPLAQLLRRDRGAVVKGNDGRGWPDKLAIAQLLLHVRAFANLPSLACHLGICLPISARVFRIHPMADEIQVHDQKRNVARLI